MVCLPYLKWFRPITRNTLIFLFGLICFGYLTLCILVDCPIQINTIWMGLSIITLKGFQLEIPNYYILKFLKVVFILCPGHTFTDHLAGSTTD